MTDRDRRELERLAQAGDLQALGELIQERFRAQAGLELLELLPDEALQRAALAALERATQASAFQELSRASQRTVELAALALTVGLLLPSPKSRDALRAACEAAGGAAYDEERDVSEAAFRICLAASALADQPQQSIRWSAAATSEAAALTAIREHLLAWCAGDDPLAREEPSSPAP